MSSRPSWDWPAVLVPRHRSASLMAPERFPFRINAPRTRLAQTVGCPPTVKLEHGFRTLEWLGLARAIRRMGSPLVGHVWACLLIAGAF